MIATETGPAKLTYAQFKARKTRRTITHPVVTDDDAVIAYRAADEALRKAKARGHAAEIAAAQAERDTAEQAVRDATLLLRLRALPRDGDGSYAVLKAEHPPREEDHAKAREFSGNDKAKAVWHKRTFEPALVAATLLEPAVTVDEAVEMSRDMNEGEWDALVLAAIQVNQSATDTAGLVFS